MQVPSWRPLKGGFVVNENRSQFYDVPLYSIPDVAHHTRVPVETMRSWVVGRNYPTGSGLRRFEPLIKLPEGDEGLLSFRNLVELWVLCAIRRYHRIKLPVIRSAVSYLRTEFGLEHPLADQRMTTEGTSLFIDHCGTFIDIGKSGQLTLRKMLETYLQRIERDKFGAARTLYPFAGKIESDQRLVWIDPTIKFGRPCVANTSIPTGIIADRFSAGEGINELADDLRLSLSQIEEAIRFEQKAA